MRKAKPYKPNIQISEKQAPCPWCWIEIDLETKKYSLNKPKIERCPWCNRKIRILKKLRLIPKEQSGLYFILSIVKKEGSGRRAKK